ncbi:hypothetical protein BJV77DRAFT_530169 [Russula vinacea]|nr:hypothetical protein BJV77DRAFT_530169 [Russula vinacea]
MACGRRHVISERAVESDRSFWGNSAMDTGRKFPITPTPIIQARTRPRWCGHGEEQSKKKKSAGRPTENKRKTAKPNSSDYQASTEFWRGCAEQKGGSNRIHSSRVDLSVLGGDGGRSPTRIQLSDVYGSIFRYVPML